MAGTLTVDTIQSDSSYSSVLNIPSKVNFTGGMQIGGQDTTFGGMRNRIINGDMRIDQRNAGASVTPTTVNTVVVDRWVCGLTQSSKFSVQQNAGSVTPPVGFTNYSGITSTSAYSVTSGDIFYYEQRIEQNNVADFAFGTDNAATITLSFWVRSSLTGTFGGALRNQGNTRSYPFTYTIITANTWEQKTITVAGDTTGTWATTSNLAGLRVTFGLGGGSTYSGTAGSWASAEYYTATGATSVVGTSGATFYITGVQLEKGSSSTSFEYRPYGTELALCQRYYENSFPVGTAPGVYTGDCSVHTTAFADGNCPGTLFKVTKRAAPTVTLRAQASTTTGQVACSGGTKTASAANICEQQVSYINVTSGVAGSYVRYTFEASAEL